MRDDKPNVIVDKTLTLSLHAIDFCKKLHSVNRRISDQLFGSLTSIGANVNEAQNAESKRDFIHKMKISAKEVSEFMYWLKLCKLSEHLIFDEELYSKLLEVNRIPSKIIASSKNSIK